MARGFLGGMLIGGAVSLVGAAILAVVAFPPSPPPVPPAETAPAQRAAQQAPEAGAPRTAAESSAPTAVPQSPAPVAGADTAQPVLPEQGPAPRTAETQVTPPVASAGAPQTSSGSVGNAAQTASRPEPAAQPGRPTEPTGPGAGDTARDAAAPHPGPMTAPDGADTPAPAETAGAGPAEGPAAAPESTAAPAQVAPPAPSTRPQIATDTPAPPAPVESAAAPPPSRLPSVSGTAPDAAAPESAQTGLPRIGRPATSLIGRGTAEDDAQPAETAAAAPAADAPPLERYAVPFEADETRPLLGIVLMDQGRDLGDSAIGVAALGSFPYPLTIAVEASLPDAGARMARYRAQGFEVMALVDLPDGMTGSETEVTLTAALAAVPEAVAVLEGPGTGLQGGREMSDQVGAILRATGHGIVWQPKGLDTAQKLAAREGVASQTLFRDFDSEGETPSVIRRFLDQAAMRADQQGAVIMVGRLRPDTISALLLWGLQDRASRVAVAPVSAVLRAGLGG